MTGRREGARAEEGGARKARDCVRIKVLTAGHGAVGKSCLIKRFCEGKFVPRYISTIGLDFGVKLYEAAKGVDAKVGFWDLSGHSEFFEVRRGFYEGAQALLLVYDATSRESFEALDQWLREAAAHGAGGAVRVLCANKCDLVKLRRVTEAEGRAWAETHGFAYHETSAKSGQGVDAVFRSSFAAVVGRLRAGAGE